MGYNAPRTRQNVLMREAKTTLGALHMSKIREALDALADAIEEEMQAIAPAADEEEEDEPAPPKKGKKAKAPPPDDDDDDEPAPPKKGKKAKGPSMDDVRDALTDLKDEHSTKAVIDVLSRFGVTKLGDLQEDHFAEAIQLAKDYEEEEAPKPKKGKKAPPPEDDSDDEDEAEDDDEEADEEDEEGDRRPEHLLAELDLPLGPGDLGHEAAQGLHEGQQLDCKDNY